MPARELLARQTASALLTELGITTYPVDPEAIVHSKELLFEERADFPPTIFGALFRSGNQFGIAVSSACPTRGHRRFTICHELGHYHLPDHVERLLPEGRDLAPSLGGHFRSRKDPLETEADIFANELLMPERFLRPLIVRVGSGVSAIRHIAETFDASLSAAAIRFAAITDAPLAVLLSHDSVIEWTAMSPALWAHGWARRTLRGESVPRGSGTRRLARAASRVQRAETDGSTGFLCEWFDDAPKDIEVTEDAIGLGPYGRVLTVLEAPDLEDRDPDDDQGDDDDGDWRGGMRGYRLDGKQ
jgi:IrrE N-terminal-like domain